MRISIDRDLCAGHGRCAALAPDIYDSDEDGAAIVKALPISLQEEMAARRGALACPERAIAIKE